MELLKSRGPVKRAGAGFLACCPAHGDKHPSLSVKRGDDGRVLFNCQAGCSFGDIAAALGIEQRELFADDMSTTQVRERRSSPEFACSLKELASYRKLPLDFLAGLGWDETHGQSGMAIAIPYLNRDGEIQATRYRRGLSIKDGVWWASGQKNIIAYEPDRGELARAERYVIVCEGETDTATLLYAGFPALGCPGATNVQVIEAHHLEGVERVFYVREPDRGGDQFAQLVPKRLAELGFAGGVHELKMPNAAKDPSALWVRDPEAFPGLLRAALEQAQQGPKSPLDELWKTVGEWGAVKEQPAPRSWLLSRPDPETNGETSVGVLPLGKAGLLYAEGGTGKTFALTQLAVSVAVGRRWLDHFTCPNPGPVLLALAEEDPEEMKRRIWAVGRAMRLTSAQEELVERRVVAVPLAGTMVSLFDADGASDSAFMCWLKAKLHLAKEPWRLVVLDPLSRFAGLDTEKDNAAATRFVQQVESLLKAPGNPTVLVAHHSRKPPSGGGQAQADVNNARGAKALTDGFRWSAELAHSGSEGATFKVTKSNYAPRGASVSLVRDESGCLSYTHAPLEVESNSKRRLDRYETEAMDLARLVSKQPGLSRTQLLTMYGVAKHRGLAMLDDLEQRGLVRQEVGAREAKLMFPTAKLDSYLKSGVGTE
jgi:RecA-family ATPase